MSQSTRSSSDDHRSTLAFPIAELEIIRVNAEGYTVPKDTCGTVVAIYDSGVAYAVAVEIAFLNYPADLRS